MTRLADVLRAFEEGLFLPDTGPVEIALGTVIANRLPGDPVWLLLVGPPSAGKSEVLAALSSLPDVHEADTLTEAGLLSGAPGSSGSGGLLREVGDQGIAVFGDLSPLFGEHSSTRERTFGVLRRVYDGHLARHLGTEGGRSYVWQGKLGLLGAVTGAVELADLGALGERFIRYRMPDASAEEQRGAGLYALENAGHQRELRARLAKITSKFLGSIAIPDELPPMTAPEQDRLIDLALVGTRCRSAVVRDRWHADDIVLIPEPERVPRLLLQLAQLRAGLLVLGVAEAEVWRLLVRIVLDGLPSGRRAVLGVLAGRGTDATTSTVAGHARLPVTTVRRHLEDLFALEVVERTGEHPERWRLGAWLDGMWPRLGFPSRGRRFGVLDGHPEEPGLVDQGEEEW